MLIKFGSIVVDGRGKLGGQVYSKNRGGSYVRNNAIPVNPQTPFQQASRAILTQLSQQWSTLSQERIRAWNAATDKFKRNNIFGDAKKLSGKNLFTSLNKNLIEVNEDVLLDPPSPEDIVVPVKVTVGIEWDDGTLNFFVQPESASSVEYLTIRATPVVSAGTSFIKNKLRVVEVKPNANPQEEVDISASYVERFGIPQPGDKIFVGVSSTNLAGQKSPEVIAFGIVQEI